MYFVCYSFVLPDGRPNAGRAFTFLLDEKSKQKNQENFILPPTNPTPARAKFSPIAHIPIASGL